MSEYPCPHGKPSGTLVICTAPTEHTGASKDWMNFEKIGVIVTPVYCAKYCPLDTPKPTLRRE